jgi:hypothetical protein
MISTQEQLDARLDRQHTINVEMSQVGPLPHENEHYNAIRSLVHSGFTFTPRELLHAIGSKTAALPFSAHDECIKAALLYTYILDLEGPYLSFQGTYGSDLQTARSQEVGIGMMCLVAQKHLHIPWDQLGPLPALGKRFDYKGGILGLDCILECKGTSHIGYQASQINNGIEKKDAHHARGEHFDIELIISTYIGHEGSRPRILVADPDKRSLRKIYSIADERYLRLRHYCRVLQFIGLPDSAYELNNYAREYLQSKRPLRKRIMEEKYRRGRLESVRIEGDEFLGRWFDSWLPKESKRYAKLYNKEQSLRIRLHKGQRHIFQGLRRDFFESGFDSEPFRHKLLEQKDISTYKDYNGTGISVFPDGTIQVLKQN